MQSSSSSRSFKPGLIGASPITDANLVVGLWLRVDSGEMRCARQWVYQPSTLNSQPFMLSRCNQFCTPLCEGGGSWCESTWERQFFKALVPQQLQGGFRKPVFVGASPTRGPIYQGRDVTVSISACDADCAGANPVALTIEEKMRGERSKEIGLSASGFCSGSNPSPGTMISTPEFG